MSSHAVNPTRRAKPSFRTAVVSAVVVVVIAAMAFSTKIVKIGSAADAKPGAFTPADYGATEFPKIQAAIEARAVDAATLAAAIAKDSAAAATKYGIPGDIGPEYSVKFTGVASKPTFGIYYVTIPGVPSSVIVRVQTGPAINGTDIRAATGTITFEQFTNQIDYQNAGSALNNEMKKQVLAKVDTTKLTGKTISVVGAFQQIVPNSWLITPVKLDVK